MIEKTGKYAPFLIFVEGGTSNGSGLIKFKKGAFLSEKTIRPMYMKYRYHTLNPAFDIMEFLPLMILQLSWSCMSCEVVTLPEF